MFRILIIILAVTSFNSCVRDKGKGNLDLVFYLEYGGKPLVMLDTFTYPVTGQKLSFTRCAAYLANIEIVNSKNERILLKDIDFMELSNAHDKANAGKGYTYSISDIDGGSYNTLAFALGVPPDMNAKAPKDYPASNVLSSTSNYWSSWKSYIFTRIEGKFDKDNDGSLDDTFSLHCGGDTAYFPFEGVKNFSINEGETTKLEIVIDLEKYFNGTSLYDINTYSSLHALHHVPAINVLTQNLEVAVSLK